MLLKMLDGLDGAREKRSAEGRIDQGPCLAGYVIVVRWSSITATVGRFGDGPKQRLGGWLVVDRKQWETRISR